MRNISIVIQAEDPAKMKAIVKSGRDTARYGRELQFIFIVNPKNKPCVEMVHELYAKYPPDMFDISTAPKVKAEFTSDDVLNDVFKTTTIVKKCDAKIVIVASDFVKFQKKEWDKDILEIMDGHKEETAEKIKALRRLEAKYSFRRIYA